MNDSDTVIGTDTEISTDLLLDTDTVMLLVLILFLGSYLKFPPRRVFVKTLSTKC